MGGNTDLQRKGLSVSAGAHGPLEDSNVSWMLRPVQGSCFLLGLCFAIHQMAPGWAGTLACPLGEESGDTDVLVLGLSSEDVLLLELCLREGGVRHPAAWRRLSPWKLCEACASGVLRRPPHQARPTINSISSLCPRFGGRWVMLQFLSFLVVPVLPGPHPEATQEPTKSPH